MIILRFRVLIVRIATTVDIIRMSVGLVMMDLMGSVGLRCTIQYVGVGLVFIKFSTLLLCCMTMLVLLYQNIRRDIR